MFEFTEQDPMAGREFYYDMDTLYVQIGAGQGEIDSRALSLDTAAAR